VDLAKLKSRGGEKIIINGTNFPTTNGEAKIVVTYGNSKGDRFAAKHCQILSPGFSVTCLTTEGSGGNHAWHISVGKLSAISSSEDLTSYEKPQINDLRGPGSRNANTRGMEVLFLHGYNFFGKQVNVTYGPDGGEFIATDCEVFIRHEIVRCLSAAGTGSRHLYKIIIDGLESDFYRNEFGYAQPVLNEVSGAGSRNALSAGGEPVRLIGKNFGAMTSKSTIAATYRYIDSLENITYRAQQCSRTKDHEEITCFTEPGAGQDLKWTVYVDGLVSTAPYSTFLRPSIGIMNSLPSELPDDEFPDGGFFASLASINRRRLLQNTETSLVASGSTKGGDIFSFSGTNFGPPRILPARSVSYGATGTEFFAESCFVISIAQNTTTATLSKCVLNNNWLSAAELKNKTSHEILDTVANGIYDASSTSFTIEELLSFDENTLIALCPIQKPNDVSGTPGEIQCKTTEGGGVDLPIMVQIGGQSSFLASTATISYAAPQILGLSSVETKQNYADTGDNVLIYLVGTNFGPVATADVFFDDVPTSFVSQSSHSELQFQAPPTAVGSLKEIKINVAGQYSNILYFSFNPPKIEHILPASNVIGEIEIIGSSFGATNETGTVKIGDSRCKILSWTHNRIACVAQKGFGDLVIEVGGQTSDPILDFDVDNVIPEYDPTIRSLSIYEGSASGGYLITVHGVNLGPNDNYPTNVFFGGKICVKPTSNTTLDFATKISCVVPRSSGTVSVIAISGVKKSNSMNFSYIVPNINSFATTGLATHGGYKVKLFGTNFGESGKVLWDGNSSVINGGKVVRSKSSGISLENKQIVCNSGCTAQLFDEPCSTTFCTGCKYAIKAFCNLGTGDKVCQECLSNVNGTMFVENCIDAVSAVLGQCEDQDNKGFSPIIVQKYTDTSIEFVLPHGQGSNNSIEIEVAGRVFSNKVYVGYDFPVVQTISSNRGSTKGNTLVVFKGFNFGELNLVKIGKFACNILSSTHDEISCLTSEGEGANLSAVVMAGDQISSAVQYSYDKPTLMSVTPKSGLTNGNYSVKLYGSNFGLNASVYIDGVLCPRLSQNHTYLRCLIPEGEGVNHQMYIIVGGQRSNSITWSYELPTVRVITPNPIDAISGGEVTIEGSNFGIEKNDIEIYIGNFSCKFPFREEDPATGDPKFKCTLEDVNAFAGFSSVYIRVSKQKIFLPAESKMMAFACPFNTFGRVGEKCMICPIGAYCAGGEVDPIALPGYWKLSRSTFVSCLPSSACLGNNTCAAGYQDKVPFCAKCDVDNYRVDLSCHPCTRMATFKLFVFIVAVFILVLLVLNLSSFELKLATVNIMIDFVQVIALCGAYFLDWTSWAKVIFEGSRVALFNVENTEPECLNSEWTYENGYWILETLPITFFLALWFFSHILHCIKACTRCTKTPRRPRVGEKQQKK
jgi:hypothetical protein